MGTHIPRAGRTSSVSTLCDGDHIAAPATCLFCGQPRTMVTPSLLDVNIDESRMRPRSEEFRVRAAECRELARRIRDPEVKRQYEELARQWLELAEQIERRRA